jgi:hypothetical protein
MQLVTFIIKTSTALTVGAYFCTLPQVQCTHHLSQSQITAVQLQKNAPL